MEKDELGESWGPEESLTVKSVERAIKSSDLKRPRGPHQQHISRCIDISIHRSRHFPMSLLIVVSILVSAGIYLADFISNCVVLREYARPYLRLQRRKQHKACDYLCMNLASEASGYFWAMVVFLVLSHSCIALVFKFRVKKEDCPFRSALFLPLIHLWRLLHLLWTTVSCHGVKDIRSSYMNGLFSILGTALEGMPLLNIQFVGYIVLARDGLSPHMSTIFKVSVGASLVSAGYNGGYAVQSIAENATEFSTSLQIALCSGMFTAFASLIRCLTSINIIVRIGDYFDKNRPEQSKAKFYASDSIFPIYVTTYCTAYWLYYWLVQQRSDSFKKTKRCLTCLVFGYMSMAVGPLYPMVSDARDAQELGTSEFEMKLLLVAMVTIFADLGIMLLTVVLGFQPMAYLVVSLVGASGYLASIVWYITIDKRCGPVTITDIEDGATSEMELFE